MKIVISNTQEQIIIPKTMCPVPWIFNVAHCQQFSGTISSTESGPNEVINGELVEPTL